MPASRVYCPSCRGVFLVPPDAPPDAVVPCPHCGKWIDLTPGKTTLNAETLAHETAPEAATRQGRGWKLTVGASLVVMSLAMLAVAVVLLVRPGTAEGPAHGRDRADVAGAATGKCIHDGEPQTEEEKEIATRILKGAPPGGYEKLEWLCWGPHDLTGQTYWNDPRYYKIVRVKYRLKGREAPPRVLDMLLVVDTYPRTPGIAMPDLSVGLFGNGVNLEGDAWLANGIRRKASQAQ